jgi:tRNA dimethylallyltransferase
VRSRFVDVDGPAIHAALAESDPEMAKALRATDRQRLIRAFEVLEATGRSLAYWQRSATQPVLHGRRVAKFFLDVPREILRQRIQTRFRAMMISGVIEEVAALECLDLSLPATKTLGLRELLAVRAGRMSETEAVARAVTQTGQYAKRQVTWARQRMADWLWIQAPEPNKIVAEILRNVI